MSERVIITDVGPRDGLQNQPRQLSPQARLQLVQALVNAGLPAVEVGSFVSPKAVPAMAGTGDVVAGLPVAAVCFSAFVPNRRGYEQAQALGIRRVNMAIAATDAMNRSNIRMSLAEAEAEALAVIARGREDGVEVLPYIATAWVCPYEGAVPPQRVLELCERFLAAGAATVPLADTIGAADPGAVAALVKQAVRAFGADHMACHFHDTRGFGVANAYAALEAGVRQLDGSIGGLGGCPFAPGASGNVATEDLVLLCEQLGFVTGVDRAALVAAVDLVAALTGAAAGGRSLPWLRRQLHAGPIRAPATPAAD